MAPSTENQTLTISITGSGYTIRPAERAVLMLQAQSQQLPSEAEASAAVTETAHAVREILTKHCPQDEATGRALPEAGIVHYSMSTLDTQSHIQRNKDGPQLPPLFSARADYKIKFKDFSLLNTLATQFSAMKNIKISQIAWELTNDTHNSLKSVVRKLAAEDAIEHAHDYAEVLEGVPRDECLRRVRPFEVNESNNYYRSTRPQLHYGKGQRGARVDTQDLQFEPEDVRLETTVSVKFVVKD
jgi:uncharacterized protein YggE